jgi:hypothetical protein
MGAYSRRRIYLNPIFVATIDRAVRHVVADAYGMDRSAVPSVAGQLPGFGPVSEDMRRRIEGRIDATLDARRLAATGSSVVVVNSEARSGGLTCADPLRRHDTQAQ